MVTAGWSNRLLLWTTWFCWALAMNGALTSHIWHGMINGRRNLWIMTCLLLTSSRNAWISTQAPRRCIYCLGDSGLPLSEQQHSFGSRHSSQRHFDRHHVFRPGQIVPFLTRTVRSSHLEALCTLKITRLGPMELWCLKNAEFVSLLCD